MPAESPLEKTRWFGSGVPENLLLTPASMKLEGDYAIDWRLWGHRIASVVVAGIWIAYEWSTDGSLQGVRTARGLIVPLLLIWLSFVPFVASGVFWGNRGFMRWASMPAVMRALGWAGLTLPLLWMALGWWVKE